MNSNSHRAEQTFDQAVDQVLALITRPAPATATTQQQPTGRRHLTLVPPLTAEQPSTEHETGAGGRTS